MKAIILTGGSGAHLYPAIRRCSKGCSAMGHGFAWLGTGAHDSLHEAGPFIRTIEHRQGLRVACPEEVAFNLGWVDAAHVARIGRDIGNTEYGRYLIDLAENANED